MMTAALQKIKLVEENRLKLKLFSNSNRTNSLIQSIIILFPTSKGGRINV